MKQFLITLAAVFLALLLFFVGAPIVLIGSLAGAARPQATPDKSVLTLDLRETLTDQDSASPLAFLQGPGASVVGVVKTLHHAEGDPHVRGLFVRLPEGGISPAAADEVAGALRSFRASGKPVLAFSQGLYPSGVSTDVYMLGAASGRLWMQPGSSLQSVGISVEEPFLKKAFDKYGVSADFQQRGEYKNAVNPLLYDDYTPAHREAELGWLQSIFDAQIGAAAADRRKTPDDLKARLQNGPYSAEDAVKEGLADRVAQEHDAEAQLISEAGDGAKLTDIAAYRRSLRAGVRPAASGGVPKIAVISAEGDIVTGSARRSGFSNQSGIFSDDVAKAFYTAAADADVRAIVFRVSSPGGSPEASEQILDGVRAAIKAGKPVVVSMGAYAASGGYWISTAATEIVAEPTTLTGSIGVFGGKFVLGPALARFGVDLHGLSVGGDFASAFNSEKPFTPEQKARFSAWIDHTYQDFLARVAAGRRLPLDRVAAIAKGRIWTGAEAQKLGLVDRLGGYYAALGEARRLGRLTGVSGVVVEEVPGREGPFDALHRTFGVGANAVEALSTLGWALSDPRAEAALKELARARAGVDAGLVLAPTPLPR